MKKIFWGIVFVSIASVASFKGYIWFQVYKQLSEIKEQVAPFATVKYGWIYSTFDGEVGVRDIKITPFLLKGTISIDQISLKVKDAAELFKLRDKRYGWKKSYPIYNDQNPLNQEFDVISTQKMETTFQCSTLVRQDPSDVNSLTASDVLNEVVDILQSDETVDHFMKNYGVGILRVVELPQTYIIDDKDQNESEPKCEFTLEHERVRVRRVPQVKSFDAGIQRV